MAMGVECVGGTTSLLLLEAHILEAEGGRGVNEVIDGRVT